MTTATHGATSSSTYTNVQSGVNAEPSRGRIASLDIARGLVMILMAIDHVRVYSGVPAGGPTFGVFFTRWVTHFAAPAFAFLAGTGAFLLGERMHDTAKLSRYLFVRGVLLVALELTVLRFAWTFNLDYANYNLAGVIWMLGCCMILMAGLVWLPPVTVGIVGCAAILGQDAFTPISNALPSWIGSFLYNGGAVQVGLNGPPILILYVIVPWVGVMAAGYWFGRVMAKPVEERKKIALRLGAVMTVLFVAIAGAMVGLTPAPEHAPPALLRMLNQRKYPASQLFLLMTLGPTLMFVAAAEGMRGKLAEVLATYGRVPMFYYLLHIPLIHLLAIGVSVVREGAVNPWLFANHPVNPGPVPAGYRWSLPLLYLVFAGAVTLLYYPCRWFAAAKARDRSGLLRYL